MLQGALVVRTSSQGLATATLVPSIQAPTSCVLVKLSDQKIYLNKIITESPQRLICFGFFQGALFCKTSEQINRVLKNLEAHELDKR
jgi:hypothetical protein